MNLIVHIPDEHAARVSGADPARLERAALEAVLRATEGRDQHALVGIAPHLPPLGGGARRPPPRPGNQLPPGVGIRDLMTYGRA
jgi:hypothetical protein